MKTENSKSGNMNSLQLVTYSQATQLKILGFDWETYCYYFPKEDDGRGYVSNPMNHNNTSAIDVDMATGNQISSGYISCPTIQHAFMFLREKHKLLCEITIYEEMWDAEVWDFDCNRLASLPASNTYFEAESAALDAALEYLLKQEK